VLIPIDIKFYHGITYFFKRIITKISAQKFIILKIIVEGD